MRAAALVATLALGCGRIGFDPPGGGTGDDGGTIDAPSTGTPGARWLRGFGMTTGGPVLVAGAGGEVVAAKGFQTSYGVEGATLTGQSPFGSTGVVRYDATGTIVSTSVLDATGYCDLRGIGMRGDDALITGLTIGTTGDPMFGACSVATNRQDPYVVRVERGGAQHLAAHWAAGGANAQGWRVAPLSDGTMVMAGIYGQNLTVGTPLPMATVDPSAFLTRFTEAVGTPHWAIGATSPASEIHAGPLATEGNDTCAIGSYNAAVSLFGQPLAHAGGYDIWVARFDPSGTARWVRGIGSSGDESDFGDEAIAVAPNGGCYVSFVSLGNLTVDAHSFPAADGPAVFLQLDGTGTVIGGTRIPSIARLATIGGRLYGAADVDAPVTDGMGTVVHTPMGTDVVIAELSTQGVVRLVGVLGGTGDQHLYSFAAIAGDALAIGAKSTGTLVWGSQSVGSGAVSIDVVAALGL